MFAETHLISVGEIRQERNVKQMHWLIELLCVVFQAVWYSVAIAFGIFLLFVLLGIIFVGYIILTDKGDSEE